MRSCTSAPPSCIYLPPRTIDGLPLARRAQTYGSLSLFYGGLESLLGPPKMYKGTQHEEKSLYNMMEFEHTADKDSKASFTSPNGTTTTSATEWAVVTVADKAVDYPERAGYREHHPKWCVPQHRRDRAPYLAQPRQSLHSAVLPVASRLSRRCRVVQPLDAMLATMDEQCNSKLRMAGHAELILEELVGGRLYTGPMYYK